MALTNNEIEAEKLYKLELHETINIGTEKQSYMVTRVIGGWIYHYYRLDKSIINSVFVKFNNEFM